MSTRELVQSVLAKAGITSTERMDSLDVLDVAIALEEALGVRIPDQSLNKITNEDELVEMLDGLKATA